MQKIPGKKVHVILTDEQLQEIERIQKRHNMTKSEAVRSALGLGLDVYADFERAGIPQIAEAGRKAKDVIRNYLQPKLA